MLDRHMEGEKHCCWNRGAETTTLHEKGTLELQKQQGALRIPTLLKQCSKTIKSLREAPLTSFHVSRANAREKVTPSQALAFLNWKQVGGTSPTLNLSPTIISKCFVPCQESEPWTPCSLVRRSTPVSVPQLGWVSLKCRGCVMCLCWHPQQITPKAKPERNRSKQSRHSSSGCEAPRQLQTFTPLVRRAEQTTGFAPCPSAWERESCRCPAEG